MARKIGLYKGGKISAFAAVDDEHFALLKIHRWNLNSEGYARTIIGSKYVFMHELICRKKPSEVIDHLDFNRINNRATNLRATSNNANLNRSRSRQRKDIGVGWHGLSSKWRARAVVKGKDIYLGLFNTKTAAVSARNTFLRSIE